MGSCLRDFVNLADYSNDPPIQLPMAHKPIIFVGIGSSGLYVLEQIQNFCYENTGKNRPSWAQYLYLLLS